MAVKARVTVYPRPEIFGSARQGDRRGAHAARVRSCRRRACRQELRDPPRGGQGLSRGRVGSNQREAAGQYVDRRFSGRSARGRRAMRCGVVVFPGSNCDHDVYHVLKHVLDQEVLFLWHDDATVRECELVVLPGGFSYGDYLRSGAMAAHSPIMAAVREMADAGGRCSASATDSRSCSKPECWMAPCDATRACASNAATFTSKSSATISHSLPATRRAGAADADRPRGRLLHRYGSGVGRVGRIFAGGVSLCRSRWQ